MQGFVTCVLNPKAYMFTLAVYPQFMLPKYGQYGHRRLPRVITVVAQGAIYGGLGLAAAKARDFLTGIPAVTSWIGRGAGWTVGRVGVVIYFCSSNCLATP